MKKIHAVDEEKRGEIILYKTATNEVDVKVRLEKETIWLTQKQIATLFDKSVPTINEHIKSIFKEGEIKERSGIRNFRIPAPDGKVYNTNFYNQRQRNDDTNRQKPHNLIMCHPLWNHTTGTRCS